jgi:hypothetical protein
MREFYRPTAPALPRILKTWFVCAGDIFRGDIGPVVHKLKSTIGTIAKQQLLVSALLAAESWRSGPLDSSTILMYILRELNMRHSRDQRQKAAIQSRRWSDRKDVANDNSRMGSTCTTNLRIPRMAVEDIRRTGTRWSWCWSVLLHVVFLLPLCCLLVWRACHNRYVE